jgi:hypothetical protein
MIASSGYSKLLTNTSQDFKTAQNEQFILKDNKIFTFDVVPSDAFGATQPWDSSSYAFNRQLIIPADTIYSYFKFTLSKAISNYIFILSGTFDHDAVSFNIYKNNNLYGSSGYVSSGNSFRIIIDNFENNPGDIFLLQYPIGQPALSAPYVINFPVLSFPADGYFELPRFVVEPQWSLSLGKAQRSFVGKAYGLEPLILTSVEVEWERLNQEEFDIIQNYINYYGKTTPHYIDMYPEAHSNIAPLYCTIDSDLEYIKRPESDFYYNCSLKWLEVKE